MKSLRNPLTIGRFRVFGDVLPFIGFEALEVDRVEIEEKYDISIAPEVVAVQGDFFTIEWLGYGISFGGVSVPVDD